MKLIWKLSALVVWIAAACIGLPLLVVLMWLLSSDSDFTAFGKVVIAAGVAVVALGSMLLLRLMGGH